MPIFSEPIQSSANNVVTDSRFVEKPQDSIFFAIQGERHNGHDYIEELSIKGIKEFVVEKGASFEFNSVKYQIGIDSFPAELEKCTFWVVDNSIKALQKLSTAHRSNYKYPVIGITGSNAKTIVKEWLSYLLSSEFKIVKSPRSYNSQIGVALSVLQMDKSHNLGIFEAGISQPAEMQHLEDIIHPTIGIFTNIGSAHSEGFRSQKQKITEKLRLFRRSKFLIYRKDFSEIDEEIRILLQAVNPNQQLVAWSTNQQGTNWVNISKNNNGTSINLHWDSEEYEFRIPFTDDASIENSIHCAFGYLVICKSENKKIDWPAIEEKFESLKPIAMRLELKQGINDCYLIDDTYNNDLAGLGMALNFLNQQHTKRDRVLILSDMFQAGLKEKDLCQQIAEMIQSKGIEKFIGIGEVLSKHKNLFSQGQFYKSTEDLLTNYPFEELHSSLILVKGARKFEFERVINRLIQKIHGTIFEVNLDALTHNLNFYRSKIGKKTKIMVMVKAFAYGSGSTEVASLLQYHRVDYLAVAYPDEGVELRKNGIKVPIMVLNPQPESYSKMIEFGLEPEIYSLKTLKEFINFLKTSSNSDKQTQIHIKLDTGMHRLGFISEDLNEMLDLISQNPTIKIKSIFSHLVGADESEHNEFSKSQIKEFGLMSDKILKSLTYKPWLHICNTAGIVRFPEAKFDMVRLGIGLYGVEATGTLQDSLQTVGTLKTTISQIKQLKKGESVGYSRKGVLEQDAKIATIAIGYADGYDRRFSRGIGKVWVNGTLCPVVGNVCMDMTMIDVSNAQAQEGDQVIIFGKENPISVLSESVGTIPYELLTGVSGRVKRIFFKE